MSRSPYPIKPLVDFFHRRKVGTIAELKRALGSHSSMTVFRKLHSLDYLSSCSHSGKFYTLRRIVRFDEHGLWHWNTVLFSSHGNLKETLLNLIHNSHKGFTAAELSTLLGLHPNASLFELISRKKVTRLKLSGVYVYLSIKSKISKKQELARQEISGSGDLAMVRSKVLAHELNAAIILFFSSLDEQQRRLYAGMESLKLGHGGDHEIAKLLDIDIKTVSKGRKQLLNQDVNLDSVRKTGGGRKKLEKKSSRGD
jgi:hypothetical protein